MEEANVDCVLLLAKLDDRVVLNAHLIEGEPVVLTLYHKVSLPAHDEGLR